MKFEKKNYKICFFFMKRIHKESDIILPHRVSCTWKDSQHLSYFFKIVCIFVVFIWHFPPQAQNQKQLQISGLWFGKKKWVTSFVLQTLQKEQRLQFSFENQIIFQSMIPFVQRNTNCVYKAKQLHILKHIIIIK